MSPTSAAFTSPLLELLFEEDHVGHCLVAPDGTIVRANAEWLRATGFVEHQVLGENVIELFPATRDMTLAVHARVRAGHRVAVPRHAETVNGRETWWEGSIAPVPMEGGTGLLISAFFRDVTAEKRAADALAWEAEKYRGLFQNSLDAVYLARADGTILEANPAACRLHGMTVEEIVRAGRHGLVVTDDRHAAPLSARVAAGHVRAELTVRRKDGTTVPVEVESVLLDAARPDSAAFVISRDITAWKRAEEELRRNLASTRRAEAELQEAVARYDRQVRLFEGVASTTPDFVYVFDVRGRFLYANRRLLEVWGMQLPDVIGKTCRELGYEQWHHDMHMREIAQVIETRRPIKGEVPFTAPLTGISGVYEYIFTPVLGPDGEVETIAGTTRDVTDRKRAEEALRDSERVARARTRELETLFACVADGLAVYDEKGRIVRMNAAGAELYARLKAPTDDPTVTEAADPTANLVAPRARLYIREDGSPLPAEQAPGIRALRGETVVNDVVGFVRGERDVIWLRVSAAPLLESGAQLGAVVSFADVSAAKQREEALRDVNQQLRDVDRRRTEFLALLSHELRNPLAPIRNGILVLQRAPGGSEQAERAKQVIHRQSEHLTRLVDDLLDVTRISRGKVALKRDRLDLRELVRRATDDLRDAFEKAGVDLRVEHLGFTPVWIDADPTRVSQVIGNLLQNAAKFTRAGGSAAVSLVCDGASAELRVRDTGIGMDPATIDRMFEPFAQADHTLARSQGGLGLGLALVKALVELHGGTVDARSDGRGKGTEVIVRLPLVSLPATPRAGSP